MEETRKSLVVKRTQKDYSLSFKLQVVREVESGALCDMEQYNLDRSQKILADAGFPAAAEWSCLVELTEKSALAGGKPVEIPDFTRGGWQKIKEYRHGVR